MKITLYNTQGRALEPFEPLDPQNVKVYACGPTVYNYAHLGNLRTYIFEDILIRALEYAGYPVTHVMNVTDVGHLTGDGDDGDDKLVKAAVERGMSPWDIARFYTDAFFSDTEKLNIKRPTIVCKATDHVQDMIELIQTLEDRGFTYVAGGNVYFDVSKFSRYGDMALLDRTELKAGARIEVDGNKRNPQDFVLWFTNSKFGKQAMLWDSPWGEGYPGWHIECSAMSRKYLGDQFDVHCGGVDHIAVHHTNEIAQTEAATGKDPWVKYWLHAEFLLTKDFKMSKSAGNFLTVGKLEELGYEPVDYRFFCLGAHYRTQLTFTEQAMDAARSGRRSLFEKIRQLPPPDPEMDRFSLGSEALQYLNRFEDHVAEDLNMPRALAELWGLLKDQSIDSREKGFVALAMDRIFGLGLADLWNGSEQQIGEADQERILKLIDERNEARKQKDFSRADQIRDQLKSEEIELVDTPQGTTWKILERNL